MWQIIMLKTCLLISNKKADGSSIKIIQADEIDKGYVKEVSMKDLRCYMEDKE